MRTHQLWPRLFQKAYSSPPYHHFMLERSCGKVRWEGGAGKETTWKMGMAPLFISSQGCDCQFLLLLLPLPWCEQPFTISFGTCVQRAQQRPTFRNLCPKLKVFIHCLVHFISRRAGRHSSYQACMLPGTWEQGNSGNINFTGIRLCKGKSCSHPRCCRSSCVTRALWVPGLSTKLPGCILSLSWELLFISF